MQGLDHRRRQIVHVVPLQFALDVEASPSHYTADASERLRHVARVLSLLERLRR
jgi:hypothetical protein